MKDVTEKILKELDEDQSIVERNVKINELNTLILVRSEVTQMITNILNYWLSARQQKENALPEDELKAIQFGVNKENEVTLGYYNELKSLVENPNQKVKEKE